MLQTLLLVLGLFALALLVVLYWRSAQRAAALQADLNRLRVLQRDTAVDVRARLEEGVRAWEDDLQDVRGRVNQLEPSLADLSATLEEQVPSVGEAHGRLGGLEERLTEVEIVARASADRLAGDTEERVGRVEKTVATLREAENERLEDVVARMGRVEEAITALSGAADGRLEEVMERVAVLEQAAAGAGSTPANSPATDAARTTAEPADEGEEKLEAEEPVPAASEMAEVPLEEAVVAAADAPATYGSGRGRNETRDGPSSRWLFIVLALAGGAALVLTTLS